MTWNEGSVIQQNKCTNVHILLGDLRRLNQENVFNCGTTKPKKMYLYKTVYINGTFFQFLVYLCQYI